MSVKSKVDTHINLQSEYSNSSINDSIFFNSSISVDVITLICVIAVILLAVGLFLRFSKKIAILESEIVVILRILKCSRAFDETSACWDIQNWNKMGNVPANKFFETTYSSFSVKSAMFIAEDYSTCWRTLQEGISLPKTVLAKVFIAVW